MCFTYHFITLCLDVWIVFNQWYIVLLCHRITKEWARGLPNAKFVLLKNYLIYALLYTKSPHEFKSYCIEGVSNESFCKIITLQVR